MRILGTDFEFAIMFFFLRTRYRPRAGGEGPPRGPIRASLLPAFWPSQSTCRFRPMTWTPSDTTDAIQSVVGLALLIRQ